MEDDLEKLSLEETSTKTHIDIVKTVTGPPIEEGSKFPANGSRGPKGFLDLPGEIRNLIYRHVLANVVFSKSLHRAGPDIVINAEVRSLAMAGTSLQIRHEFLSLLMCLAQGSPHQVLDELPGEPTTVPCRIGSARPFVICSETALQNLPCQRNKSLPHRMTAPRPTPKPFASLFAWYRDHEVSPTFDFCHPAGYEIPCESIDRIEDALSHIFNSEEHITFEHYVIATDQISTLGPSAIRRLDIPVPGSDVWVRFSVTKQRVRRRQRFLGV